MLVDPVRAARRARDAEADASTWPIGKTREVSIATAQWLEGEAAFRASEIATAEPLIAAALNTVMQYAPGTKLNADLLMSRARIKVERGKPQDALNDLQHAYRIFTKLSDVRSEARALQSIGSIYQNANDFDRVIYYYKLANDIYNIDPTLQLISSNNMASAYAQIGKINEAEIEFKRALIISKKLRNSILSARILDNIADLQLITKQFATARITLAEGINLTVDPKASSWLPMLLGTRARLDLAEGRPVIAVRDIELASIESDQAMTNHSYRPLHLTAYRAYKATGNYSLALKHLEIYRRMDDEGRALAASTSAALLAARFDFANQDAQIAVLKTGQLQRDAALARVKARQSTIALGTLVALFVIAIISFFFYLRTLRISRNKTIAVNAQLEKTNTDLAEALSAKSQFLATTSHEIRTPLNGILGMTQVMLADITVTGVQRERISLVNSAGKSMRSLVDDILSFAKIDAGMLDIDIEPVDLRQTLTSIVELWRLEAIDKKIELLVEFNSIDSLLMTDSRRLYQIVFNLLSNAMKFTIEGSIKVHAYSDLAGEADMILIDFHDTGVGVPNTAFETIFEPFRQLDTSTTRRFGGTGLGLAISRHLARALGGDITVSSVIGAGSTFHLRLPYIRPPAVEKSDAGIELTVLRESHRQITVVSNNPITRSLLSNALSPYLVNCDACDVFGINTRIEQGTFDVVLLDAESWTGERNELDELVMQLAANANALAILSSLEASDRAHGWRATGVADVIVKPVSAETLASHLNALVASSARNVTNEKPTIA